MKRVETLAYGSTFIVVGLQTIGEASGRGSRLHRPHHACRCWWIRSKQGGNRQIWPNSENKLKPFFPIFLCCPTKDWSDPTPKMIDALRHAIRRHRRTFQASVIRTRRVWEKPDRNSRRNFQLLFSIFLGKLPYQSSAKIARVVFRFPRTKLKNYPLLGNC